MMPCMWWMIKVFVLMHLFTGAVRGLSFVVEPKSQNVSERTVAVFNCTAYSLGYYWLINNELPESDKNKGRGLVENNRTINGASNLKEHILIVPGYISNSGIIIKCSIYSKEVQLRTGPVTLRVQGLLDAVSIVQVDQLNPSSILVSYVPPYTLEGIPIRNYSIDIFIPENTSSIRTYYTLTENITLLIENPCYEYSINISAWNDVGQGETASISTILYDVPYSPPRSSTISLHFQSDSTVRAILYTTVVKDCLGRVLDNITIILDPSSGQQSIVTITSLCLLLTTLSCDNELFYLTDSSEKGKVDVSVDLSAVIDQGFHYKAFVIFSNRIGNSSSSTIELNTFHTITAEVTIANYVCLKCTFADGNSTKGCLGMFVDRNRMTPNQSISVPTHLEMLCFLDFPPGDYDVLVYDSEQTERLAFELRCIVHKPNGSIDVPTTIVSSSTIFPQDQSVVSICLRDKTGIMTEMPVLVITLCVSSGFLILLSLVIVSLMVYLMKYNRKNRKLKIAELSACQKERTDEVFLHTLTASISSQDKFSPTLSSVNPLYESVKEVQTGVVNQNEFKMIDCAAYAIMPMDVIDQS